MSGQTWKEKVAQKRGEKQKTKLEKQAAASSNVGQKINTQGWRTSGNAYLFQLEVNEKIVAYYLGKYGQALPSPQQTFTYDFEFHPMHTTGNPVYIRMVGNDDTSLMTKFDTKNKSAPKLPKKGDRRNAAQDFHNLEKLTLNSTELAELEVLIKSNFAFLQYMAKCVYEEDGIC